jgi:hypothetical protein
MSGTTFWQTSTCIYLITKDIPFRIWGTPVLSHSISLQPVMLFLSILWGKILNRLCLWQWNTQLCVSSCHRPSNFDVTFYDTFSIPSELITNSRMKDSDECSCIKKDSFQNIFIVSRPKEDHISHLPQQCHNSKYVIFSRRILNDSKCYNSYECNDGETALQGRDLQRALWRCTF